MTKTIIKETGIVLLLLIAIVLILGIIFYDYIPNNKTVSVKVEAYAFPQEIKEELQETVEDEQNIFRTYYIDSEDLNLYETTKEYNKGKANPFATTTTNTATATTTNTSSGNTTTNANDTSSSTNTSTTNTNTNIDTNSTASQDNNVSSGEYFNKAGKY